MICYCCRTSLLDFIRRCKNTTCPANKRYKHNKISPLCEGCTYIDEETWMCASHEGCIRADDRNPDYL